MNNILQWNCRGFRANFDELSLLAMEMKAAIICLQETYMKPTDNYHFSSYHIYNTYGNIVSNRPTGGSSILIKQGIIHSHFPITTNLQATAVRLTLHRTFTVCSLYIPPNECISLEQLNELHSQLPSPYLLLGDFNGHHPLWGGRHTDRRGKITEDFINAHSLCLLNDGSHTYLHPGYGTYSAIDISLSDPILFLDYDWSVLEETHGSDHFPLLLKYSGQPSQEYTPRWKLNRADWDMYVELCTEVIVPSRYENVEDALEVFSRDIIEIANKIIPKSKANPFHSPKPWFDSEVQNAIKERKKALRKFNSQPIQANLDNFKILRAKARRLVRQKKRDSWRIYISKLNSRTPSSKVWQMVKRIQGKDFSSHIQHLVVDTEEYITPGDIANKLGQQFSYNSSSENYSPEFRCFKDKAEQLSLNIQSDNSEDYNNLLTLEELQNALLKAKDSATGPDDIHYQLLKHLPLSSLKILVHLFNNIWDSNVFPPSWRLATIVPIPKPNKDHSNPNNYRPIALTSCLCKTMERIVNDRLVWYLESHEIISEFQCGFRHHRSTLDHLVRLETYIRDAFITREHVVAVFFDLEKAYDTTWKFGIMKDLFDFGLRGRLPKFIGSFLQDRWFRVRVGSTLSNYHPQEMGVPQGSILSPTCFNIKINSIVKSIKDNMMCSLYVDDFLIAFKSKQMSTIERQLQINLNSLQKWSYKNGFKFSKAKTVCMHFCRLRSLHPEPNLMIEDSRLKVVDCNKFLGVLFDSKLSFTPHIQTLKAKSLKSLNLLKVVSRLKWGGDSTVLLRLYRAITRSRLDYGSIIYGSARPSYLTCLNTVHHQGLRLSLGAFRTSPVESLYVLAQDPPLSLRRIKLSLQYIVKLAASPTNPAYHAVFQPNLMHLYEAKPNAIPTLGLRMKPYLTAAGIDTTMIAEIETTPIPSWRLATPLVNFEMAEMKKTQTNPLDYRDRFHKIKSKYPCHKFLYTDGSKDGSHAAYAVTSQTTNYCSERLPDISSIYTAELIAIYKALRIISDSDLEKFVICSDSKSALQAIKNKLMANPMVLDVLITYANIPDHKEVVFCWVPSHVDIEGNEKADFCAKQALQKEITDFTVPYSDFQPLINDFIMLSWQSRWNALENNKLHSIFPNVRNIIPFRVNSRRDQTVLNRCLIGHTRLTHLHLLFNEDAPLCEDCHTPLTVKHILIDCNSLQHNRLYQVSSLHQLFTTIPAEVILHFLIRTGHYFNI